MKRFFEEHTSVAIICIVVSLLLCIIGCINNVNNDGTVAGKGLLKIVGDNLTDTIDTYQKQIVPNDNLLARTSSKITEITKVNDWGWIVGQEHGEGYYYRCIPNQYYTFKVYIDNSKNDKTTLQAFFSFFMDYDKNEYIQYANSNKIQPLEQGYSTITVKSPPHANVIRCDIRSNGKFSDDNRDYIIRYKEAKLELGKKATPYVE